MRKIVRNCTVLLEDTAINLTLTHALVMTLTLTRDPNSNPNPTAIPHLFSAFRNSAFYRTPHKERMRPQAGPIGFTEAVMSTIAGN